jgi:hypothetical protein
MKIENNVAESENNEIPQKISEITCTAESSCAIIRTKEEIKKYVEQALISACEELYDKNIRTIATSANQKDIEVGYAYIDLDFDSLSKNNQSIGEQVGEIYQQNNKNFLKIKTPVNSDSTVEEIKNAAGIIVHKFQKQPMTWAPKYTLQEARELYRIDPNDERYDIASFEQYLYYDKKTKLFYFSQEHAQKTNESIE